MKRHKTKGLAYCRWTQHGTESWEYFGPWGSDEAKENYRKFQLQWASGAVMGAAKEGRRVGISELVELWRDHCRRTYIKRGKQTSEVHCNFAATVHLNELYGREAVSEFDGRKLRTIHEAMIGKNWARKMINDHIARIVRAFGWAVTEKLVEPAIHQALLLIEPLAAGGLKSLRVNQSCQFPLSTPKPSSLTIISTPNPSAAPYSRP